MVSRALTASLALMLAFVLYGCSNQEQPEEITLDDLSKMKNVKVTVIKGNQRKADSGTDATTATLAEAKKSVRIETNKLVTTAPNPKTPETTIASLPFDGKAELQELSEAGSGVEYAFDEKAGRNGALKVTATQGGKHRIRLVPLASGKQGEKLTLQGKLMTQDLKGHASLEMSSGASQKLKQMVSEVRVSTYPEWSRSQSVLFKRPSVPLQVELVLDGTGTVWVDDVKVLRN